MKAWQKVLIERLVNQTYTGNFDMSADVHVFPNRDEHEDWFFNKRNYPRNGTAGYVSGLAAFEAGGDRSAIDVGIEYGGVTHSGAPTGTDSGSIERSIMNAIATGAFNHNEMAASVFHGVRAKILHVYEEGRLRGTGATLYQLGTRFTDIVNFIVREYVNGHRPIPTAANQQDEFKRMLGAAAPGLNLYNYLATNTGLIEAEIIQAHNTGAGVGTSHTSW